MLSEQREPRQVMIEADACFPVVAVVTTPAGWPQFAAMYVVCRMAGRAFHRELELFRRPGVAGLAFHLCMFADQRKPRHLGMIELHGFPCALIVAAPAIHTVAAFVRVVLGVASETGDGRARQFRRLLVT